MKIRIKCAFCGREIERYPSEIKKHNFCCRSCLSDYSSRAKNPFGYGDLKSYEGMSNNMKQLNAKLNGERMTQEVRGKLRRARLGTGTGKGYEKTYGRHTHRLVMEEKIGRALLPGEVVHHIDGNKRNNSPQNLMLFSSQAEHAAWHKAHEGGDAL